MMRGFNNDKMQKSGPVSRVETVRFIPCTVVNSLLITSLRAAECTASRRSVDLPPLFQASPSFDNARKTGVIRWARPESISWGVPDAHPNRDDTFDSMVMQTGSQTTNLPRRFLRENAGAKNTQTETSSERTLNAPSK
jgi:hypothetical protein